MASGLPRTSQRRINGEPLTEEQARRLRADLRFRLLLLGGGLALGIALGLALVAFTSHQHPEKPIRWPVAIGIVAGSVAVAAVAFGGAIWLRNRNHSMLAYVVSGDRKARVRVAKQLRKGQPVAEEDSGVAQATVDITRRQWWLPLLFAASGVCYGIALLVDLHPTPPRPAPLQAMRLLLPFMMLALAGYYFLLRRRLLANAARQGITPTATTSKTGRDDHAS